MSNKQDQYQMAFDDAPADNVEIMDQELPEEVGGAIDGDITQLKASAEEVAEQEKLHSDAEQAAKAAEAREKQLDEVLKKASGTDPDDVKPDDQLDPEILAAAAKEASEARRLRQEMQQQMQALQQQQMQYQQLMQQMQQDPLGFMDRHGGEHWFEKATQQYVKSLDDAKPKKSETEILREELHQLKQSLVQREVQTHARTYTNHVLAELEKPEYSILKNDPATVDAMFNWAAQYQRQTGRYYDPVDLVQKAAEARVQRYRADLADPAIRKMLGLDSEPQQEPQQKSKRKPPAAEPNVASRKPPKQIDLDDPGLDKWKLRELAIKAYQDAEDAKASD